MLNRFLVISAMTCMALAHDASAGTLGVGIGF